MNNGSLTNRSALLDFLTGNEQSIAVIGLLLLIFLAVFQKALWFVPGEQTDLVFLSFVAKTQNPISVFFSNTQLFRGQNQYRPLQLISYWFSYKLFGISALPSQVINLTLHFINICLLWRILLKAQRDIVLSFLLASLALISIYTYSPATWISDRATLIVALCLLSLIDHFIRRPFAAETNHVIWILCLSVLALMSKESGVIVPIFAVVGVYFLPSVNLSRKQVVLLCLSILVAYALLRAVVFGSNIATYSAAGYLLGSMKYDQLYQLPRHLQFLAFAENVIKNLVSPILPVFDNFGQFNMRDIRTNLQTLLLALPALLLMVLASIDSFSPFRIARLVPLQKCALAIAVMNSLIHFQVFRLRVQYIAVFAFCLFLAASPLLAASVKRKRAAQAAAVTLVFSSVFWVNVKTHEHWFGRYEAINRDKLSTIDSSRVDPNIIEQVLKRYSDRY